MALVGVDIDRPDTPVVFLRDPVPHIEPGYRYYGCLKVVAGSHEIPDVDLPGADEKRMESLRDYLTKHGVFTTIRASRGQDIFAACGLLSTERMKNVKM